MGPAILNQVMISIGQRLGGGQRIASTVALRRIMRSMQGDIRVILSSLYRRLDGYTAALEKDFWISISWFQLGESDAAEKAIGRWCWSFWNAGRQSVEASEQGSKHRSNAAVGIGQLDDGLHFTLDIYLMTDSDKNNLPYEFYGMSVRVLVVGQGIFHD